jgi:hypothetical protein
MFTNKFQKNLPKHLPEWDMNIMEGKIFELKRKDYYENL